MAPLESQLTASRYDWNMHNVKKVKVLLRKTACKIHMSSEIPGTVFYTDTRPFKRETVPLEHSKFQIGDPNSR